MTIQEKDYSPALMQGAANSDTTAQAITSATSQALAIGANGATNPVLNVDASTASVATGLGITGAATGTAVALAAIGSASTEFMTLAGKGTGGYVTIIGNVSKIVSGLGATLTMTKSQSGAAVLLDRAAGTTVTLPANTPGFYADFFVTVTVTSNADKIITAAGTELLVGTIINTDTDTSDAVASWKSLVATSNIAVSMNGSTTGGIKGDWLRFTCLNTTTWNVQGLTLGTGSVATPFATS